MYGAWADQSEQFSLSFSRSPKDVGTRPKRRLCLTLKIIFVRRSLLVVVSGSNTGSCKTRKSNNDRHKNHDSMFNVSALIWDRIRSFCPMWAITTRLYEDGHYFPPWWDISTIACNGRWSLHEAYAATVNSFVGIAICHALPLMMPIHLPWRLCHLTLKLDEEWRRESAKAWKVVIATGLADFQPLSSLPYPYLSSFTFKRPGRITRKTQQKWWDPKQQRNLQELLWRIPILEIISWGYKWQNSDGTKCSNRTNDAIHDCGRTISEIVLPEWHRRVSDTRKPNLGTNQQ